MAEIYTNFVAGTTTDNPLTSGATTINSAGFASLPVVAAPDFMWITLDPGAVNGAPELVKVTAHSSSATSCTIERAGQSTTARAHPSGSTWYHAFTKADADKLPHRLLTTTGDILYGSAANTATRLAVGTSGYPLTSNGTIPAYAQLTAAGIASDAVTTAKILDANVTQAKMASGLRVPVVCTSGTRPGSPTEGDQIYETDTNRVWSYNGSSWVIIAGSMPRVSATKSTTQSIANGTETVVTFPDAERYDTDGLHSTTVNPGRITIPAAMGGVWSFGYSLYYPGAAGAGERFAWMRVNGGSTRYGTCAESYAVSRETVLTGTSDLVLSAGDYVEVATVQSTGAALDCGQVGIPIPFWATYRGPA